MNLFNLSAVPTCAASRRSSAHSSHSRRWTALLTGLTLGLVVGWTNQAVAQTDAPSELTATLDQIDAAASEGDVEAVMRFYSPEFTSSDGLTYDTMETMLGELWQRYPNLSYETQLDSWESQDSGISAVTTTTITGVYPDDRRDLNFSATITSRQRFEDSKIVAQEILSERSELKAGEKPPTLTFNLPEEVSPRQEFDFDAIVTEPLGNRLLLGAAIEEPITVENYLNPAPIELELLASGGLFKIGRAPATPGDRWISAIIVRYDGITAVTQRLRVGD